MTEYTLMPLSIGEIELSQVVHIGGVPHATKHAIGEWLEYHDPRSAIDNIIDGYPQLRQFSLVVKIPSHDGQKRAIEVFNPAGFLLIVMESAQPKAHEMKIDVANFVWRYADLRPLTVDARMVYVREIECLIERLTTTREALLYDHRRQSLEYLCTIATWPMPDLTFLGKDIKQLPVAV
jgi:hypothetical protein